MARPRTINASLIRVLDQSPEIIYVLSPDGTIQYANPATAAWVGVATEDLFQQQVVYASQPLDDPASETIRGLAIDPQHFSATPDPEPGRRNEAFIFAATGGPDQPVAFRDATVVSLSGPGGVAGSVMVVAGANDVAGPDTTNEIADDPTSSEIHALLTALQPIAQKRFDITAIVGRSPHTRLIASQAAMAASAKCNVLICGPTGCGREHLARAIHAHQNSAAGLLLPVDGTTATVETIAQWWKSVSQGPASTVTLLLLNIDQMNEPAKEFLLQKLSATATPPRVITTSTGRHASSFDPNLHAIIATATIQLKPLTDRREDIPLLAQQLLEQGNADRPIQLSGFSDAAMNQFVEYDWPRNVDQLARVIQLAASGMDALNAADPDQPRRQIGLEDLPTEFQHQLLAQRTGSYQPETIDLGRYLAGIELVLIDRALQQSDGNKTQAAKRLGISRAKLIRRLDQLPLPDKSADADTTSDDVADDELLDESIFEETDE